MKKFSLVSGIICLMLLLALTSCLKNSGPEPAPILKIGLVGGLGGFSDAGFNENILKGFKQAAIDFPIACYSYECKTGTDFSKGINYFLSNRFDLIITAGYDAAEATITAANTNPATDFLILDYSIASPPPNLLCAVFDVDQASFPCGFLAAYWAYKQNKSNPVTGFVAGPEIPEIRQFSVSYINGVSYFNNRYNKNVKTIGCYATSFSDTLQGARLADSLMQKNASVIFAFAGKTGNGALYKVKAAGKWAIGVDVDQFYSIPLVGPILLTSCMKELDVMVYNTIKDYYNFYFQGGKIIHGNLDNRGVGMAPFHNFETMIPDSIKLVISNIEAGIKNGTIKTGWPE